MPTTLANLKPLRQGRGITTAQLAHITGIRVERLNLIESRNIDVRIEPWLEEAALIARALCTDGIAPLISCSDISEVDHGATPVLDTILWASDARVGLAVACRLSIQFGLRDPQDLLEIAFNPLLKQIWSVVASGERVGAPQICPWCCADLFPSEDVPEPAHLPTCLPHFLWGTRGTAPLPVGVQAPLPGGPGRSKGRGSAPAYGLRRLRSLQRDGLGMTQPQFSDLIGFRNWTYYAKVESQGANLTMEWAEKISVICGVPIDEIYRRPDNMPPPAPDGVTGQALTGLPAWANDEDIIE